MTDDELPDRLREALQDRASGIHPEPGAWSRRTAPSGTRPRWVIPGLAAAAVVALAVTVSVGIAHRTSPSGSTVSGASTSSAPVTTGASATDLPLVTAELPTQVVSGGPTSVPEPAATSLPPATGTPVPNSAVTPVSSSAGTATGPVLTVSSLPTGLSTTFVRASCGPLPERAAQPNIMCPMDPERTMPADSTTTAAALGWGVSDIGQNGATITMEGSADGSVTMTNGADTRTFDSSSGPVHVFSTPVLNGRGVWGVVSTTVTKIVITSTADAAEAIPVLHPLGRWQGFVSAETSDVEFPATVAGFDADGRQVFSVVIQA